MESNKKFENKITEDMLNYYGLLHGGESFKLMDSTAGYISRDFVNGRTVTKAADEVIYYKSAYLNETIVSTGKIINIGNTSMKVYVENRIKERDNVISSSGYFTMVYVDEDFKPKKIEK